MGGRAGGLAQLTAGDADSPWASGPLALRPVLEVAGSPSWLAAHPHGDVVYAAHEGDGTVQAYLRTGESALRRLGPPVSVGELVCHIAVDAGGRYLLASCWGDGRVVRVPLGADGRMGTPSVAPAAVDPYSDGRIDPVAGVAPDASDLASAADALRRAVGAEYADLVPSFDEPDAGADGPDGGEGDADVPERVSRAHQAVLLGGGAVATMDMGLDLVRFWRPVDGGLRSSGAVALPRGSGPRHAIWHPSGHLYVLTELSCEIFVLARGIDESWRIVASAPVSPAVTPGSDLGAEISLSRDASVVYAGVRGVDAVGALRVAGSGDRLEPTALVDTGVTWPRHHVVVRDTLLVAGERSHEVVSLPLDDRTGIPGRVRHRIEVPSPTCLLPVDD